MARGYKAMSKKRAKLRKRQLIGAYDIETFGMGGEYLDGFTYVDGEEPIRHDSMRSMLDELLSRPDVMWYAHNASNYEYSYIIELLQQSDYNLAMTPTVQGESRIIGLRIDNAQGDKVELRDSLAILPMSLDEACKKFSNGAVKLAGSIDWEHETYDRNNPVHVEYARQDVLSLVAVMNGFSDLVEKAFGVGITMSTASTALNCWYNTLEDDEEYYRIKSRVSEEMYRNAYYGGYVYPGSTIEKQTDIISIDRNAAYAAAMECGVPYGECTRGFNYVAGKPAIYHVIANVRETSHIVPCIPMRSEQGLLWPKGTFETWITSVEYDHAATRGYSFEVLDAYVFEKLVYPFTKFTRFCEELEKQPGMKDVSKLMRNGLYGKFGTALIGKEFKIGLDAPEGFESVIDEETGRASTDLHVREQACDSIFIMPAWAAFITANQRVWLFKTIEAVGDENVVYCDTDSVKAKKDSVNQAIERGDIIIEAGKYGACKVDEEYSWFQCLGPKVYRGVLTDGKSKHRAKGLKKKQLTDTYYDEMYTLIVNSVGQSPDEIEKGRESLTYMEIEGTRSAMAMLKSKGASIATQRKRRITDMRNSKTWKLDGTKISPPLQNLDVGYIKM